jgi:thioredoxin reductase (NADPH)
MSPSLEPLDCLIVGAGPAGLTAALYLQRFHRRVRLLDDGHSRALRIERTHNYPGFPDGIAGAALLARLKQQLGNFDGQVVDAQVQSLERRDDGLFEAATRSGTLTAHTVLLATGVVDNTPELPGIDAVRDAGLLRQCPICDGHEFSGRHIAVIGSGTHGAREAMFLRYFSDRVSLAVTAGPLTDETLAALREASVRLLPGQARRIELTAAPGLTLHFDDGSSLPADVLYAALGTRPRSGLARALNAELDAQQNLLIDAHCATSVPGLYAAGDVVSALDQLAVATGHGAIAATAIHNRLSRGHA